MKFVLSTVPVLPVKPQPELPLAVCQLALPLASDVNTLFNPCVPSTIRIAPLTSNFFVGEPVPIPTFTFVVSPSTKLLLIAT